MVRRGPLYENWAIKRSEKSYLWYKILRRMFYEFCLGFYDSEWKRLENKIERFCFYSFFCSLHNNPIKCSCESKAAVLWSGITYIHFNKQFLLWANKQTECEWLPKNYGKKWLTFVKNICKICKNLYYLYLSRCYSEQTRIRKLIRTEVTDFSH